MAGTLTGGRKAAETNKKKYGEDFYSKMGSKGGSAKVPKGFALMTPEKRREAGRIGGKKSSRSKVIKKKSILERIFK